MSNKIKNVLALLIFGITSTLSGVIAADTIGSPGTISKVYLSSTASDDYGLYHGYVILSSKNDDVRYNWGGSYCPGVSFFTDQNKYLLNALIEHSQSKIIIEPRFKVGQGGNLCLVSFAAVPK